MGVIEVEVPEGIPLKPLKKKINELAKEEEARWALYGSAKGCSNSNIPQTGALLEHAQ